MLIDADRGTGGGGECGILEPGVGGGRAAPTARGVDRGGELPGGAFREALEGEFCPEVTGLAFALFAALTAALVIPTLTVTEDCARADGGGEME